VYLGGYARACDYSPDGNCIAVGMGGRTGGDSKSSSENCVDGEFYDDGNDGDDDDDDDDTDKSYDLDQANVHDDAVVVDYDSDDDGYDDDESNVHDDESNVSHPPDLIIISHEIHMYII
jgi:hypothetical protein